MGQTHVIKTWSSTQQNVALSSGEAEMVGVTENEGYEFKRSRALKQGKLCGLALDFENAGDEVAGRVEAWAEQLKREFG